MDNIFSFRKLMKKFLEKRKNLCMVFINVEKPYDRVPSNLIW